MGKIISIWAFGSIVWIVFAANAVFEHYAPLLEESAFIYNPMMSPYQLLESNAENREKLLRTFAGNRNQIHAFGAPGEVRIEFAVQSFKEPMSHTWMPYHGSFSAVETTASEWVRFRQSLIDQALAQRDQMRRSALRQHGLTDLAAVLGVPSLFLVVILAYIFNWRLLDQPTGNRFPDV